MKREQDVIEKHGLRILDVKFIFLFNSEVNLELYKRINDRNCRIGFGHEFYVTIFTLFNFTEDEEGKDCTNLYDNR